MNNNFKACDYCNKRDVCVGECTWNQELLDSAYVNYYSEQLGLKDNYYKDSIMMEIGMFGIDN